MFLIHILLNRNYQSNVSELKLCFSNVYSLDSYCLIRKLIKYAILRNLECLYLDLSFYGDGYDLSALRSKSLKKLTLLVKFQGFRSESDCWDLPALTYLSWESPPVVSERKLLESCLTCLPSLTTLCLRSWILSQSSFSFSLPHLTTLRIFICARFPLTVWNFPALLNLELDSVDLPLNMSRIFPTLVNLQNLTLYLTRSFMEQHHSISCPQLLNLNISIQRVDCLCGNIKVLAPKLRNFTSLGILSITFEVPELENVKIKLHGWFGNMDWIYRKKYYPLFTVMLSGLGDAKILTFDLDSMKALSVISDLASLPSPFYKLKHVKLPQGHSESTISSALRSYLLGGSPRATIVTTVPQSNTNPQAVGITMTSRIAVLQEPLAAPTKELENSQYIHQNPSVDTENVEEIGKDRVSSVTGNRDFGLWRGHKVNSEFVCLLDRIMHKYPETFEHFTTKNKKLCTMHLNMLCASLNDFTKISMTEVDSEMIVGYRDVFAYLQNQGFDISWAVCRLNYIEHLRFSKPLISELHAIDCRIDDEKSKLQELEARVNDVKTKLQDLQALRAEKLAEIEKAFGTMGANIAVGFIGDDLLSSP